MKNIIFFKQNGKLIILLSMLLITSVYMNFSPDISENSSDLDKPKEKQGDYNEFNSINSPKLSDISVVSWWNNSFFHRRVINITNHYDYALVDYIVSLEFDYSQMVTDGKLNSSLKDIRIVENGIQRNYYVKQDHPSSGKATVWFETNVSAGPNTLEQDVFMYYGNNSVEHDLNYYLDNSPDGVAWWNFEDTPGSTTIADNIGDNNGYTRNGITSANWVDPGKAGLGNYAMQFNNYEYIALDMAFLGAETINAMTVTAWVKVPDRKGDWSILDFDRSEYFTVSVGYEGYTATDDVVEFDTTGVSGGTNDMVSQIGDGDVADGTWHHIACVFNSEITYDKKIYIDGQLVEQSNAYTTGVDLGHNINRYGYIGDGSESASFDSSRNGRYYTGSLDEVRYFDYSLSDQRIEEIYNFTQEITTVLNEEQGRTAIFNVTAIDVNGNYIPYVNITIHDLTQSMDPIDSKITNSKGNALFTPLDYTPIEYNFTVTMESNIIDGLIQIINSSTITFSQLYTEINLICNVTTHIFRIKDVNGDPVESGWVVVGNATSSFGEIQNCTINTNGEARFWWYNFTPSYTYNYTIYYRDEAYYVNEIILETGSITEADSLYIDLTVNLTTIYFTVRARIDNSLRDGVNLRLKSQASSTTIVDLTTDINGNATLRWWNSSGSDVQGNYSVEVLFSYQGRDFNMSVYREGNNNFLIAPVNFTVDKKATYDIWVDVSPGLYKSELTSLNPTDSIAAKWGTNVLVRTLFNVTEDAGEGRTGPAYADSMLYTLKQGQTEILSGTMPKNLDTIGTHYGIIDTEQLSGGESYTIYISAMKIGFSLPTDISLQLNVLNNEMKLNQSDNDDSELTTYWLESINMTVKPYGKNSESFIIEDSIHKETDGSFEFSIPDLATDWNLSQVIFNIENVQHGLNDYIYISITDPYGSKKTWDKNHGSNYYYHSPTATNGTWKDLIVNLNNLGSPTNDNNFKFKIEGNFTGTVDITAEAKFIRDKITVEYRQFNVTDSISIPSDGNGWAINNITFELTDCYNPSSWILVNPLTVIDNIETNEGHNYTLDSGGAGTGLLTIDNITIYALGSQFVFTIHNSSNIMFDVLVKVEYIQEFYQNDFLEIYNMTKGQQSFVNATYFEINPDDKGWTDQGAYLVISSINNGTDWFLPSEIGMNITIGAQTYDISDLDVGEGFLLLDNLIVFSKDMLLSATIQTMKQVNFTVKYSISYSRIVSYELSGTVTYAIREAPDITGPTPFISEDNYYLTTIDTSLIDADDYTVRFTVTKENYVSATKDLDLNVLERLTLINGRSGFLQQVSTIYVQTSDTYTFSYTDAVYGTNVTNLDDQSYFWEYYGEGSTSLRSGFDYLTVNSQNKYVLDFNTRAQPYGRYQLFITLDKQNYEEKIVIISLYIEKREIDYSLGDDFEDKQISVVKGKTLTIEIELTDETNGQALRGAKVILEIGNEEFEFDEESAGVYELKFDTDDYETFFTSNAVTGTIKVSKVNFTTKEIDITIVVEMEEIVEGVPTFYSIIIVGTIIGIVGSLATYRFIQIARIPKFVKKVRKIKKAIKSQEDIPESLLYPSIEELMSEELSDKFKVLGLSSRETFGLKGEKERKKLKASNNPKGGAL